MSYKGILLIFFWGISSAYGQEKLSKQELIQLVEDEKYQEAYASLERNYLKYPRDIDYIYYTAVARIQLSTKIPQAIKLLEETTKQPKNNESWFYLGKAYMLNYQFAEAEEAFSRFNDKASRDQKEKVKFIMYQDMCRSAREICSKSKSVQILKIDTIAEDNLLSHLNKLPISGKLETVDEVSAFSAKSKAGIQFSTSTDKFFQSKYAFGKRTRDIFIAENNDFDNKFKSVGYPVNSPHDELFVFYDETQPAMYFSSQGHNSAGGYDIFRSFYDKKSGKWSTPENIGFPLNSPFDEVAYVTLPGTGKSVLASKRNTVPGKIIVYTLNNVENATEEEILSADAQEIGDMRVGKKTPVSTPKRPAEKNATAKKNEVPEEIRNEQSYRQMINEALNLQIRSDSIKRISDEKKEQMINSRYESEKTKLQQEIKVLDKKAEEIQLKADVLYKKARELEIEKQEKVNTQELAQKAFTNKSNNKQQPKKATNSPEQNAVNNSAQQYTIYYRIQIGVFSSPPPEKIFKDFNNLYKENVKNSTLLKYYVGKYQKAADAEKGLIKAKEAGFKDAYIIGFYNDKVVPLSRAKELELSLQKQ